MIPQLDRQPSVPRGLSGNFSGNFSGNLSSNVSGDLSGPLSGGLVAERSGRGTQRSTDGRRPMTRRLRVAGAVAVGVVLALAFFVALPSASSQPHRQATPAKLSSHAGKAYAEAFTHYKSGQADVESVYTWSVRWLDAELNGATGRKAKKKAFAAHQTRMRDLRSLVQNQFGIGAASALAVHAADYFATQAALWRSSLARD